MYPDTSVAPPMATPASAAPDSPNVILIPPIAHVAQFQELSMALEW
jgi:hypothetical protein